MKIDLVIVIFWRLVEGC